MKRKTFKSMLAAALSLTMIAGMAVTASAEGYTGWKNEDGIDYWYEGDVKQGTEGRGKEIWDGTAWYWLDAPNGLKAVSKDVYQESEAGPWGDKPGEDGIGWILNLVVQLQRARMSIRSPWRVSGVIYPEKMARPMVSGCVMMKTAT